VRRWHRSWLTVTWSLWILVAGGAAALACLHHPVIHDDAHLLLCIDSSNPAVQDESGFRLLAEARKARSMSKFPALVVLSTALGMRSASLRDFPGYELSWLQEGISPFTPASCQRVLRL
jgi:hypothetical protein